MARNGLYDHDPSEKKDYKVDFRAKTNQNRVDASGDLLEVGETLSSIDDVSLTRVRGDGATALVESTPAPALADTSSSVVIWLDGGTVGDQWEVETTVTTSAGRTYNRRMVINVTDL